MRQLLHAEAERKRREQEQAQQAQLEQLRQQAEVAGRQAEWEKQQREAAERRQAELERQQRPAHRQPTNLPAETTHQPTITQTHHQSNPPSHHPTITPTIKPLSALHPLDHLRLLWWTLIEPQQLKAYREQYGEQAERSTAKWLVSTLLWLPFFLPFSAIGLEIIPFSSDFQSTLTATHYLWASGALFIAWFLTGVFGDRDEKTVVLLLGLLGAVAGFLALRLLLGLLETLAGGPVVFLALLLAVGLAVPLAEVPAGVLAGAIKESLKTGRASWVARGMFVLLVAANAQRYGFRPPPAPPPTLGGVRRGGGWRGF